jgi:hypothetical protein
MNVIRQPLTLRILALWTAILSFTAALAVARVAKGHEDPGASDPLFTNVVLRLLKIQIPDAGLLSLSQDSRVYVKATVVDGETIYTNVMLHLKGGAGSFRPLRDKPGLTLKFDEAGPSFHGLNKIHLNNSVQDTTYLSEWLCSELFREAGVPAPRAVPVLVELNERRLGIFVLLESVDRQFLGRYFKNTHGNVYCPPGNSDITARMYCIGGRDRNNRADLIALAAAAQSPDTVQLDRVLDMDRFLSYLAMEVMLCHRDGYTFNVKNYLLFHDLDAEKMVFIPHDLDQMLQRPNQSILPRARGVVSSDILGDEVTQKRYLERVSELYRKVFVAPVLTQRIDSLVAKLAPELDAYSPDLARRFLIRSENLKTRIVNRAGALEKQLQSSNLGSTLEERH